MGLNTTQQSDKPALIQTDLGFIPEDWKVASIKEIADIKSGKRIPKGFFLTKWNTGQPYIRVADMYPGGIFSSDIYFVPNKVIPTIKNYRIFNTDIFISVAGTLGIAGKVPKELNGANLTENADRLTNILCDKDFLLYALMSSTVQDSIQSTKTLGAQPKLALTRLRNIRIPLPTKHEEQQAIAQTLSDTDNLIQNLEKLIAKKRLIKQGAMQELLWPKEGWVIKTIEQCAYCLDNYRVPLNSTQRAQMRGSIPYCGANGVLDYVNDYCFNNDIILMAEDGGHFEEYQEKPIAYRMKGKCWVNNHAHILKAREGFSQDFLFFSLVHKNILDHLANGTRAKLNKSELFKIEVNFPGTKEEQVKIGQTLNNMESEVEALETKLAKYRQIKQGMMQQLLTGKIRLVDTAKAEEKVKPLETEKEKPKQNQHFRDAVIISVLAGEFGEQGYPLGRMRYNKLAYLLKRHTEENTEGYRKKAAGPYNPDMRYSGAEDIAVKKQYMKWMDTGTYKGYVANVNQQEARKYFYRWYGQEALDWLKSFKYKNKETLELWTTVDYAIRELEEKGEAVSVASVKSVLANHKEWQQKLERDLFSDANIELAIQKVEALFG